MAPPWILAATLAHPLTERGELPVSPLFLAALALCLLIGAGQLARRQAPTPTEGGPAAALAGPFARALPAASAARAAFVASRILGLGLLVLAATAGRWGHEGQLRNIAPALVIGAGWPLLVLATALVGDVWRWLNPFDTLARLVAPLGAGDGPADQPDAEPPAVWWAVPVAVVWVAYLTMWPGNLQPRSIGTALLVYTFATLAGCLALGRRTWLHRAEVFTVFFALVGAVRTRGTAWHPPEGARLLLAVLAGGFLYGLLRDSQLLLAYGYGPRATLYSSVALGVTVAFVGGLAEWTARGAARWGDHATVVLALIPAAVGLALALALARQRVVTSVQLLPILASDPFGRGWDLLGTARWRFLPQPLGPWALVGAQSALLLAGCVAGVVLAARRATRLAAPRNARRAVGPALSLAAVLLVVGVAAAAAT